MTWWINGGAGPNLDAFRDAEIIASAGTPIIIYYYANGSYAASGQIKAQGRVN